MERILVMHVSRIVVATLVIFAACGLTNALATDNGAKADEHVPAGYPNWKMPTLGGLQYWTDVRFVGGWKVQRNSNTSHHRLIDGAGKRIAWGNLAHCDQQLQEQIALGVVRPNSGKLVIVVHGLCRTCQSMSNIADYLEQEGEYTVINFQYASTRETIETHAADLQSLVEGLSPDVTEINFVCHSLGNIVVRCYLGNVNQTATGRDARIARMVMLGAPNHGSQMSRILKNSFLFKTLAGAPGVQLGPGWERLETKLAIPDFEFGIVAGAQEESNDFSNFVLRGPDDFTVSLQETKLTGAHDLLILPLLHSSMMNQPEVLESTLRFLQHGYFISESARQPIGSDEVLK